VKKKIIFFLRLRVLFFYSYADNTHSFHRLVHMAYSSVYPAICTVKQIYQPPTSTQISVHQQRLAFMRIMQLHMPLYCLHL